METKRTTLLWAILLAIKKVLQALEAAIDQNEIDGFINISVFIVNTAMGHCEFIVRMGTENISNSRVRVSSFVHLEEIMRVQYPTGA